MAAALLTGGIAAPALAEGPVDDRYFLALSPAGTVAKLESTSGARLSDHVVFEKNFQVYGLLTGKPLRYGSIFQLAWWQPLHWTPPGTGGLAYRIEVVAVGGIGGWYGNQHYPSVSYGLFGVGLQTSTPGGGPALRLMLRWPVYLGPADRLGVEGRLGTVDAQLYVGFVF